ncbi:MAG: hypothetical protein ACJA2M_003015 [Polaribacter sp.]|jgi:hypothetical protein
MKVCKECFNDVEIRSFIEVSSNEKGNCNYCSNSIHSELIEVGELLDFFAEFVGIFEKDPNGNETLTEIIQNDWNLFAGKSEAHDILCDILLTLGTPITSPSDIVSYSSNINDCISYWDTLKEELKWQKRFLTNTDELSNLKWDKFFNDENVLLPSQTIFYRARVHHAERKEPYLKNEMGYPEKEKVSEGRANPQGIPYLYLSKSVKTTLYETRVSYLDELSIGEFKIKNDERIFLVDFTERLNAYKNIDDIRNHTKRVLLKNRISKSLSKPIRRYDSILEYIPTQFICEYIRYITNTDGILFNSSLDLDEGVNVVLFEEDKVKCDSVEMYRIIDIDITPEKI